jgi:hypothetical protein
MLSDRVLCDRQISWREKFVTPALSQNLDRATLNPHGGPASNLSKAHVHSSLKQLATSGINRLKLSPTPGNATTSSPNIAALDPK